VNTSNLRTIVRKLFEVNIIRGRCLLGHAIIRAQIESPFNTSVYAALVSFINSKFPEIGEIIIKILISSFRENYLKNNKQICLATTKFLADLVNQSVVRIRLLINKTNSILVFSFRHMKSLHWKFLFFYLKIHPMIVLN
jgi:pre-mRNA-splicing factor CWC22